MLLIFMSIKTLFSVMIYLCAVVGVYATYSVMKEVVINLHRYICNFYAYWCKMHILYMMCGEVLGCVVF